MRRSGPRPNRFGVRVGSCANARRALSSAGLSALLLAGCVTPPPPAPAAPPAVRELYMVMPEEDGGVGIVEVTLNDGRQQILRGEFRALAIQGDETRVYVADKAELERNFGPAVAALPRAPLSIMLQFQRNRAEPTAASRRAIEQVGRDFLDRPSREIWVVGHTDTVGSDAYNDTLSIRRAERVRQLLIGMGVPSDSILVKGKGKRDPLVPTPDNTDEPRNRRVEISVR